MEETKDLNSQTTILKDGPENNDGGEPGGTTLNKTKQPVKDISLTSSKKGNQGVPPREPLKLSPTSILTYKSCPRQFYYSYILKIPTKLNILSPPCLNSLHNTTFFFKNNFLSCLLNDSKQVSGYNSASLINSWRLPPSG